MISHLTAALVALLAFASAPSIVSAGTVLVANDGVDDGNCGSKTAPCRSITRAIAVAGAGDTVLVGPGRYGDLNGDGLFNAPGEETADIGNCNCVVAVQKPLKLLSRDGASATVIDIGSANLAGVSLEANGVVFGKKGKGFTITGGSTIADCVYVLGDNGVVAGNIADNCARYGFLVGGTRNLLVGNVVSRCSIGLQLGQVSTGNVAKLNRATACTLGMSTAGTGDTIADSVVDRSEFGFELAGANHTARGLRAVGNLTGIIISADNQTLSGSSAVGNRGSGIEVFDGTTGVVISTTNMFGNGTQSHPNCGLEVRNGGSVTAVGNFWGAASGPGADPADAVCPAGNGTATTEPFAAKEQKVKAKGGL